MKRNKKILIFVLSIFVLIAIVFFTLNGNFLSLMGNSVVSYYCLDNASYIDGKCVREIKEPAYFIGDVDKSGDITIQDATILQLYMNNAYLFDSQQLLLADCNDDG